MATSSAAIDVGDADVFKGDHGQSSPEALPVEGKELMTGTAGYGEIAAPDGLLHGRTEQYGSASGNGAGGSGSTVRLLDRGGHAELEKER